MTPLIQNDDLQYYFSWPMRRMGKCKHVRLCSIKKTQKKKRKENRNTTQGPLGTQKVEIQKQQIQQTSTIVGAKVRTNDDTKRVRRETACGAENLALKGPRFLGRTWCCHQTYIGRTGSFAPSQSPFRRRPPIPPSPA